ncbi:FAD/NAD(P)-binding protein [Planctomycetota bacterium]
MSNHRDLSECPNPYFPHQARIIRTLPQIPEHQLFQIRFEEKEMVQGFIYRPGQFVMLSVVGTGEAPFSISSSPTRPGILELCVRRIGHVTNALFELPPNALVGIRGPYGNGFPVEDLAGNSLLLVAGGLGMASLRSLLWYALDNRSKFRDVTLMYGAKNPDDMLFKYELLNLIGRADVKCLLTVDTDESGIWKAHMGVVTKLFEHLEVDPAQTYAAICGPDVMFRSVLEQLLQRNFSKDRILMSLERNM